MGAPETGFRSVPWESFDFADDVELPQLDLAEHDNEGPICPKRWSAWGCTRPDGHDGTCRASGLGRQIYAEWHAGGGR